MRIRSSFSSSLAVLLCSVAWPVYAQTDDAELEVNAAPAADSGVLNPPPAAPATPTAQTNADAQPADAAPTASAPSAPAAPHTAAAPAPTNSTAPSPDEPQDQEPYLFRAPLGFRVSGFVQGQFEHHALSEDQLDPEGEPLNLDRFLLRRARLRLDHGTRFTAATLELDANTVHGENVGIRRAEVSALYRGQDAKADAAEAPLVAVTGGITDVPFGWELGESLRDRVFMERSVGSLALFPSEADAGIKVQGSLGFFRYAVALMNGEPLDERGWPRDPNSAKDVVGRLGAAFAALPDRLDVRGGLSFSLGRGFHAGKSATKDSVSWVDENEDGVAQPNELIGVPGTAASPSENFRRWAVGADLGFSLRTALGHTDVYGEAAFAQNQDRGFIVADPVLTGVDVRHAAVYGALTQDLTEYGFFGVRYSVYDANSDVTEQRAGELLPLSQVVRTLSPVLGVRVPGRVQLSAQYDWVDDSLARDRSGVPTDADNDVVTVRLQGAL
jgi:hypothetical protein